MASSASLGDEAFTLLWTGLRRAHEHKVASVGSDYPMLQLCEEITDASRVFAPSLRLKGKIAGYLSAVSGDASEAARWESHERLDAEVPAEVLLVLREAQWRATPETTTGLPSWTSGLIDTVTGTWAASERLGVAHGHNAHLALGVMADPGNRASEALGRCEIDLSSARAAVEAMPTAGTDGDPWTPAVSRLADVGALVEEERPGLFGRLFHRAKAPGSVLPAVHCEAVRQAARAGDDQVDSRHILVAVLALGEQLTASGRRLTDEAAATHPCGPALAAAGLTSSALTTALLASGGSTPRLPPRWPAAELSTWTAPAAAAAGSPDTTPMVRAALSDPAVRELVERAGYPPDQLAAAVSQ